MCFWESCHIIYRQRSDAISVRSTGGSSAPNHSTFHPPRQDDASFHQDMQCHTWPFSLQRVFLEAHAKPELTAKAFLWHWGRNEETPAWILGRRERKDSSCKSELISKQGACFWLRHTHVCWLVEGIKKQQWGQLCHSPLCRYVCTQTGMQDTVLSRI